MPDKSTVQIEQGTSIFESDELETQIIKILNLTAYMGYNQSKKSIT